MGIAWFPGIFGALTKLLDCKTSVDILEVGASSGLSHGATWFLSTTLVRSQILLTRFASNIGCMVVKLNPCKTVVLSV